MCSEPHWSGHLALLPHSLDSASRLARSYQELLQLCPHLSTSSLGLFLPLRQSYPPLQRLQKNGLNVLYISMHLAPDTSTSLIDQRVTQDYYRPLCFATRCGSNSMQPRRAHLVRRNVEFVRIFTILSAAYMTIDNCSFSGFA